MQVFLTILHLSLPLLPPLPQVTTLKHQLDSEGKGEKITNASVYIVLLGCSYANQLDRAFATFEDYSAVFDIPYDLPACNALLFGCLRAKNLQVGAAMSVLSEMERLGVSMVGGDGGGGGGGGIHTCNRVHGMI